MNAGPKAVIIVPYKSGPVADLGPVVKSDYFGAVPADRFKITPEAVLFRADGSFRSKIGISQPPRRQRARLDRLRGGRADAGPVHHAPGAGQMRLYEQHVGAAATAAVHGRRGQRLQRWPQRSRQADGRVLRNRVDLARQGTRKRASRWRIATAPSTSRPGPRRSTDSPSKHWASTWTPCKRP